MRLICLLFFTIAMTASYGQKELLTILEKDGDGKYLKNEKRYVNKGISDINSRIHIAIDKAKILEAIGKTGSYNLPDETAEMLRILHEAMRQERQILSDFYANLENYDPTTADPLKASVFNRTMARIAEFITTLMDRYPVLMKYYEEDESTDLIAPFFNSIRKVIAETEAAVINANKDSGASIQMGAWLYHNNSFTPVHLTGFDALPQEEYYTLERWNFMPSEDQLRQLRELQTLAKENRDAGLDILKTAAKNYINVFAQQLKEKIEHDFADVIAEASAIRTEIGNSPLPGYFDQLQQQLNELKESFRLKIGYYQSQRDNSGFLLDQFLSQINADIKELNNKSKAIHQTISDAIAEVNRLATSMEGRLNGLRSKLQVRLSLFATEIEAIDLRRVAGLQRLNTAALEFGESVYKLSLQDLPTETEIDLNYTGRRVAGDRLVIKMSVTSGLRQQKTQIESREIFLYRVAPHLEGTVGVVFANPFKTTAIQKDFQMAPYYNLLIKGAWPWGEQYRRRSALNNTLKEFSWGLHVSSPDFNKDDVPELAVGLVVSGLKDYLQIGIAHNVFENVPFWFFGIRLPVPAMNFGGSGSTGNSR